LMRPRRGSGSTKGDCINDDTKEGYIVDSRGRIRGEARRYDPYARFGEIMLYEIDAFGFVSGYVSRNWQVMSEEDLLADRKMGRRLREAKYQAWKRHNVLELLSKYERHQNLIEFEQFCRRSYEKINANK